jgi:hypothetical protein
MDDTELIFDHVGVPTDDKQPSENLVVATKVWLTSPRKRHMVYKDANLWFGEHQPVDG